MKNEKTKTIKITKEEADVLYSAFNTRQVELAENNAEWVKKILENKDNTVKKERLQAIAEEATQKDMEILNKFQSKMYEIMRGY